MVWDRWPTSVVGPVLGVVLGHGEDVADLGVDSVVGGVEELVEVFRREVGGVAVVLGVDGDGEGGGEPDRVAGDQWWCLQVA